MTTASALSHSRQTIASYEDYADRYCALVSDMPNAFDQTAFRRLAEIAGAGGRALEIGSGPGWDADFLETLGLTVRRTDATKRFLELQAARGKKGELLDVITDPVGGPYDAVVAMCVLIHIPREEIDQVLAKLTHSLRPGGALIVSMREGDHETTSKYHTVYWRRDDFADRLAAAGLKLVWDASDICSDGDPWNTFLAVRRD
ncbi:MAG: class I SAM-dependent methyltransferase [Rhizobiaceae bacterium]